MAGLFRDEVVAERAASLFGGVAVPHDRGSSVFALLSLLAVAALVAALSTGTYARKERAIGRLVPASGIVRITAPRAGILDALLVTDGARVARGDALFTVMAPGASAGGANAQAAALAGLVAERESLRAQRAAAASLAEQAVIDAQRRVDESVELGAALDRQLHAARERAALLARDLERLTAVVDDGLAAASLLDLRRAELLGAQAAAYALERDRARLDAAAAEARAALQRAPLERDQRLAELRARSLALDRAIAVAEAQWASTVRAPAAGRVVLAGAATGGSVSTGEPILAIVPTDGALQAELLVPARAVGFLGPGQRVQLRYDAFPHRKYGAHAAHIRTISATSLAPDEPVYRVVAAVDAQSIAAADGARIPLRAGFTLQADIERDRRRIIEWLFEPLLAAVAAL